MFKYRKGLPFPWNVVDPDSENYSSMASLFRDALKSWLKTYGKDRYVNLLYMPQEDAFICAVDNKNKEGHEYGVLVFFGRARKDLFPEERDRIILSHRLSLFESLKVYYHAFNRKIFEVIVPTKELLEFI